MPTEIKTEIRIPDLWFDFYARLLPGLAFVGFVRVFLLGQTGIPPLPELFVLVACGYLAGLIIQPLGSITAEGIQWLVAWQNKHEPNFVRDVQRRLGYESRSAMIISKMHGEVTFFTQLAFLAIAYFVLELFAYTKGERFGGWAFLVFGVAIAFAFEVAFRRHRRAVQQHELLSTQEAGLVT